MFFLWNCLLKKINLKQLLRPQLLNLMLCINCCCACLPYVITILRWFHLLCSCYTMPKVAGKHPSTRSKLSLEDWSLSQYITWVDWSWWAGFGAWILPYDWPYWGRWDRQMNKLGKDSTDSYRHITIITQFKFKFLLNRFRGHRLVQTCNIQAQKGNKWSTW